MSNPRDLIVKFNDQKNYPNLGTVVASNGMIRAYALSDTLRELIKAPEEASIVISTTNSEGEVPHLGWASAVRLSLTKEQALALIIAIADNIRDAE